MASNFKLGLDMNSNTAKLTARFVCVCNPEEGVCFSINSDTFNKIFQTLFFHVFIKRHKIHCITFYNVERSLRKDT